MLALERLTVNASWRHPAFVSRPHQRLLLRPYDECHRVQVWLASPEAHRSASKHRIPVLNRASASPDQATGEWPYLNPLLLAFFASQRRSTFAARCLVEAVIDLYAAGQRFIDIQLEFKLTGMQEEREIEQLPPDARRKARQMVEIEKDVLLQWIALIFLTLKDLDCEWRGEAPPFPEDDPMARGMRGFVQQTLALGFSLEQLQLQQQLADSGEQLPSVKLMQENARLIVLTAEIVKMNRAAAFEQWGSSSEDESAMDCVDQAHLHMSLIGPGRRASAARALLAFLGAAKGSLYSVNSLVEEVFKCYQQGWTANQIYDELCLEEFGTGKTLFPVGNAGGSAAANAQIFAQWISTIFMTLAQVGVPHRCADEQLGWAWAGEVDAVAANSLSQFVAGSLRNKALEEGQPAEESAALDEIRKRPPVAKPPPQGSSFAVIPDESLRETSSAVALMAQLRALVLMTDDLARKSVAPRPAQARAP